MVLATEKQRLRARLRERRAALAAALPRHGAALARFAEDSVFARAGVIAGYCALPGEADVAALMAALHDRGKALALPRVLGPGQPLAFHLWTPGASLQRGPYGIAEPLAGAPITAPDLILVPLLGFDATGNRLGYGGGYYDRTLAALRAQRAITAIGVVFAGQEVEALPKEDFDQRLDGVLSEAGLRFFS